MSLHNDKENYLKQVVSYVKFPFDRKKIYRELDDHITDRYDDFVCEGDDHDEAIRKAIDIMGDAKDVGTELNRIHNPLLGWIWKIFDSAVKVIGILVIAHVVLLLVSSIDFNDPLSEIDQDSVLYHLELDETAQIDDEIITLTDILYDDDGTLHIVCTKQRTGIMIFKTYSSNYIGEVTDDHGNIFSGSTEDSSRYIYDIIHMELYDFPNTSKVLNIVYDFAGRNYEFHIDLNLEGNNA